MFFEVYQIKKTGVWYWRLLNGTDVIAKTDKDHESSRECLEEIRMVKRCHAVEQVDMRYYE